MSRRLLILILGWGLWTGCGSSDDPSDGHAQDTNVSASGNTGGGDTTSLAGDGADGDGSGQTGDGDGADGTSSDGADLPLHLQYIRSDLQDSLVLEVDSVAGREPRASVEGRIIARLEGLFDKPGGVSIVHDETLDANPGKAWTFQELDDLSRQHFDGEDGTIHVMFLDGSHEHPESGNVLGLAWGHRSIAMFQESIEEGCSMAGLGLLNDISEQACTEAEFGVWLHEIGHTIGLVDNGLEMVEPHSDPDHGAHDASQDCIMYWAYEGQALLDLIVQRLLAGGDAGLDFDAACKADIATAL